MKYHYQPSKNEILLFEIFCDNGGGEGIVVDMLENVPYHKWWDMGNMFGNHTMKLEWCDLESKWPDRFRGINSNNWKQYIV